MFADDLYDGGLLRVVVGSTGGMKFISLRLNQDMLCSRSIIKAVNELNKDYYCAVTVVTAFDRILLM